MKIGIAGAGIAGLAAAALLARDGHEVRVFDQFPSPRPVGSGLMVQPVGLEVLRDLSLDQPLLDRAAPITRVFGRNEHGRPVLDVRYPDLRQGAFGLGTQRALLFDLLLGAATGHGAVLVPSTLIQGLRDTADGPVLLSEQGDLGPFDLLLDCLGTLSPLCPEPSSPLAFGALWALLDASPDTAFQPDWLEQRYRRASQMVGILPVGGLRDEAPEKLTFFWSLRGTDYQAWRAAPLAQWKDQVLALWPETSALLGQVQHHDDLIFARYAHRTLRRPARGRIAHLGDSYHATSPQLGQGANMALLDAYALSTALRQHPDPIEATRLYARTRRWHVRLYQTASWLFTPVYQSDSRVLPWLRDWITAPLGRVPPAPRSLAKLVAGELANPLGRILRK